MTQDRFELYNQLTSALTGKGWWPWSICVEVAPKPLPAMGGRAWMPRRARIAEDGRTMYGYNRSQVKAICDALRQDLVAEAEIAQGYIRKVAEELGVPLDGDARKVAEELGVRPPDDS